MSTEQALSTPEVLGFWEKCLVAVIAAEVRTRAQQCANHKKHLGLCSHRFGEQIET